MSKWIRPVTVVMKSEVGYVERSISDPRLVDLTLATAKAQGAKFEVVKKDLYLIEVHDLDNNFNWDEFFVRHGQMGVKGED